MINNKELEERALYYKHAFYELAVKVLTPYPDQRLIFEKNWLAGQYRKAYLPYMEVKFQHKIELTEKEKKINKEFYGLFVN